MSNRLEAKSEFAATTLFWVRVFFFFVVARGCVIAPAAVKTVTPKHLRTHWEFT